MHSAAKPVRILSVRVAAFFSVSSSVTSFIPVTIFEPQRTSSFVRPPSHVRCRPDVAFVSGAVAAPSIGFFWRAHHEFRPQFLDRCVSRFSRCAPCRCSPAASAQGVTTGSIGGIVTGAQKQPVAGASVIAIHEPSGTSYEATTRADGRYSIPSMRVGGPYTVQVVYVGGGGGARSRRRRSRTSPSTSASTTDVERQRRSDHRRRRSRSDRRRAIRCSRRREPAPRRTVNRDDIAQPADDRRAHRVDHAADAAGQRHVVRRPGQPPEQHHGRRLVLQQLVRSRRGQPGERTNVAPISLESIEQVQVSIAPYDVRQGSFVGAAVNTVTRSGTNQFSGVGLSPDAQRGLRRHGGARA